jgi:hypothetical protein
MKRLALLSVVALMLASAVFAPVAMAQTPGDADVQTVTLGPEGTLQVTGTIVCVAGHDYGISLDARQTQGNQPVKLASGFTSGICQTTGQETFTVDLLPAQGSKPIRKGEVVVSGSGFVCGPSVCRGAPIGVEVFELAR